MPLPSVIAVLRDELDGVGLLPEKEQADLVNWFTHNRDDGAGLVSTKPRLADSPSPKYTLNSFQNLAERRSNFLEPVSSDSVDSFEFPLHNVDTRLPPFSPNSIPLDKVEKSILSKLINLLSLHH